MCVSVVVVNLNQRALLIDCVESVRRAAQEIDVPAELLVVDNGSTDGSAELYLDDPWVRVERLPENTGFTGGVLAGLASVSGEWVLLLNNDATIAPDGIAHMLRAGRSATDVGAVGAQMRFYDRQDLINSAGVVVDNLGIAHDRLIGRHITESERETTEVFGVSGGAALYRTAMLNAIGAFDDRFFAYLEDVDLAWRARAAGWRALYEPRAVVIHHHSITGRRRSPQKHYLVGRNRVRVLAKNATTAHLRLHWLRIILYDLAYCLYASLADRTVAPFRGRIRGIRDWSEFRSGARTQRREVELASVTGLSHALQRRQTFNQLK